MPKRKLARRLIHQRRIISKIPALHRARNPKLVHCLVFVKQDPRYRYVRNARNVVRTAGLYLCIHFFAVFFRYERRLFKHFRRAYVGQPIVDCHSLFPKLHFPSVVFKVLHHNGVFVDTPSVFLNILDFPASMSVRPRQKFRLRFHFLHACNQSVHRPCKNFACVFILTVGASVNSLFNIVVARRTVRRALAVRD